MTKGTEEEAVGFKLGISRIGVGLRNKMDVSG